MKIKEYQIFVLNQQQKNLCQAYIDINRKYLIYLFFKYNIFLFIAGKNLSLVLYYLMSYLHNERELFYDLLDLRSNVYFLFIEYSRAFN